MLISIKQSPKTDKYRKEAMKYINHFIILWIAICAYSSSIIFAGLTTTMYKPASAMPSPDLAKQGLTILSSTFSFGSTTNGYDEFANPCNPLQIYGPENLSSNLLPAWMVQEFLLTIPQNLVDNLGSVDFQGTFGVKDLYLEATQNLVKGFFLQGALIVRDLHLSAISMQPILNPDLSSAQQQTVITTLTNALNSYGLLDPKGGLRKYGLLQSYLLVGWSNHFQNLEHIDFIDISIKTGLSFPEATNLENNQLFSFPFPENRNIGIPISASLAMGFLDWLTIGGTMLCMPWLNSTRSFTMNPTGSNTSLLVPQQAVATAHKNAFYYSSAYIQADHFIKGLSCKLAYSFTSNGQTTLTPADKINFPANLINQSPTLQSWYAHTIWGELEYDFCTLENPNMPTIKLFYTSPLAGKNIIKTPIDGGFLGCILSYRF